MDIVDGLEAEAEAPVYGELSLLDGETFNFLETDGGHASENECLVGHPDLHLQAVPTSTWSPAAEIVDAAPAIQAKK